MVIDRRNSVCDQRKASSNGHHDHQHQDASASFNNNNNLCNFF